MNIPLNQEILEKICLILESKLGLWSPREKLLSIERKLVKAAKELRFPTFENFTNWFFESSDSIEFVDTMSVFFTIGETYFFREEASFQALSQMVIKDIIKGQTGPDPTLDILSAGCSTGEEPYSIAIAIQQEKELLKGWKVSITGTDINPVSLEIAKTGVYTDWAFRNTCPDLKKNYFNENTPGNFLLKKEIRDMVKFKKMNLLEETFGEEKELFDIIFCRNVLMYFEPKISLSVFEGLRNKLKPNGWLFVSACEFSTILSSLFNLVPFPGTILYQKKSNDLLPIFNHDFTKVSVILPLEVLMPGTLSPLTMLCRDKANQGDHHEALTLTDRAIKSDKLNPALYCLKANILEELGRLDDAIAILQKALYLDDRLVMVHFNLGNISLKQEKKTEAQNHFYRAIEILEKSDSNQILIGSEGMSTLRMTHILKSIISVLKQEAGVCE